VIYYLSGHAASQIAGHHPSAAYGYHGFTPSAAAFFRNIIWIVDLTTPFIPLKHPAIRDVLLTATLTIILFGSIFFLKLWRPALRCFLWVVLALLPTSLLSPYYAADRYLLLALVGMTVLWAFLIDRFFRRVDTAWSQPLALLGITALGLVFAIGLFQTRTLWFQAADASWVEIDGLRQVMPRSIHDADVMVVDLPHSARDAAGHMASELNNGLQAALVGFGYSSSLRVSYMFDNDHSSAAEHLRAALNGCKTVTGGGSPPPSYIYRPGEGRIVDISGDCARTVVSQSLQQNPDLWWGEVRDQVAVAETSR
jgi:hypothetical protein